MKFYTERIESLIEKPSYENLSQYVETELMDALWRFDEYLSEQFFNTINPNNKGTKEDFNKELVFMDRYDKLKDQELSQLKHKANSKYSQFYNQYLVKSMLKEEYMIVQDMFLQNEINKWLEDKEMSKE